MKPYCKTDFEITPCQTLEEFYDFDSKLKKDKDFADSVVRIEF